MNTMSMFLNRSDLDAFAAFDASVRRSNAADWHANMAIKAYRKRLYGDYRRHIRIADELRSVK